MRRFGGPEVLQLEEAAMPTPGPGEVVLRVHAVSVNPTLDLILRQGAYARRPPLPHVLGVDPSGVITALGADVTDRKIGDRVAADFMVRDAAGGRSSMIGVDAWGGYAEYVKLPAITTYRIPDELGFYEATVVCRHFPTAFFLLRDRAQLQPGEWLLVMGAAGGLGACCVQVGKLLGATVIAAAGADVRVDAAMKLGADHGVNYRAQDLAAEVRRITGGRGVNVVAENIGDAELWPGAFYSLGRGGRLVTAGAHAGGRVELDISYLYLNQLRILGGAGARPADFESSMQAAAQGRFQVLIDRVFPLKEAARAHEVAEARERLGKIIIDPSLA